jgi:hypothetical protein
MLERHKLFARQGTVVRFVGWKSIKSLLSIGDDLPPDFAFDLLVGMNEDSLQETSDYPLSRQRDRGWGEGALRHRPQKLHQQLVQSLRLIHRRRMPGIAHHR